MNYHIRSVTPEDLKDLQAISRETFKATFGAYTATNDMDKFLETNYSDKKLKQELNNASSKFFFLQVGPEIAGYLKVNQASAQSENLGTDHFELEWIYLRQKFQYQGLGKVLLDYTLKLAREANKQIIWLGVYEKNLSAQKFYAKNGFKCFSQHTYQVGNDPQIDYLLEKKL